MTSNAAYLVDNAGRHCNMLIALKKPSSKSLEGVLFYSLVELTQLKIPVDNQVSRIYTCSIEKYFSRAFAIPRPEKGKGTPQGTRPPGYHFKSSPLLAKHTSKQLSVATPKCRSFYRLDTEQESGNCIPGLMSCQ